MVRFHFFHGRVTLYCILVTLLLYLIFYWWTLGLLSYLGYCQWCCNKHSISICLFKSVFCMSSRKYPDLGLLGHMGVPSWISWETSSLSSTVAASTYNPTHSGGGSLFSTSSSILVCWFIDDSHSRGEVMPHCFDLHLSADSWHWTSFHLSIGQTICTSSLEKCLPGSSALKLLFDFLAQLVRLVE